MLILILFAWGISVSSVGDLYLVTSSRSSPVSSNFSCSTWRLVTNAADSCEMDGSISHFLVIVCLAGLVLFSPLLS